MVEGLVNRTQEILDKLAKNHPPRIIEGEEYWEIANSINEKMKEVDLEYRIKRAQSERDANYIFLTA